MSRLATSTAPSIGAGYSESLTKVHASHRTRSLTSEVAALVRPRIAMMVLVTVFAAMWLTATPGGLAWLPTMLVLLGTGLVAASSSIANQILERESDRLMPRTAGRPLASGRLSVAQGWWLTGASLVVGLGFLAGAGGLGAAVVAAVTWLIYVVAYTPLKRVSPLNTAALLPVPCQSVSAGWRRTDRRDCWPAMRPAASLRQLLERSCTSGSFRTSWPSRGSIVGNMPTPGCRCSQLLTRRVFEQRGSHLRRRWLWFRSVWCWPYRRAASECF
jgi:hypothetical protein